MGIGMNWSFKPRMGRQKKRGNVCCRPCLGLESKVSAFGLSAFPLTKRIVQIEKPQNLGTVDHTFPFELRSG
jgi:hypothetical protein